MWQSNTMGTLDGLKLKFNNFIIDQTISYLGNNFSKQKLVNLAKIFEKIAKIEQFLIKLDISIKIL